MGRIMSVVCVFLFRVQQMMKLKVMVFVVYLHIIYSIIFILHFNFKTSYI